MLSCRVGAWGSLATTNCIWQTTMGSLTSWGPPTSSGRLPWGSWPSYPPRDPPTASGRPSWGSLSTWTPPTAPERPPWGPWFTWASPTGSEKLQMGSWPSCPPSTASGRPPWGFLSTMAPPTAFGGRHGVPGSLGPHQLHLHGQEPHGSLPDAVGGPQEVRDPIVVCQMQLVVARNPQAPTLQLSINLSLSLCSKLVSC